MSGKNFIPASIPEYREWADNFVGLVAANAQAWGIPDADKTRLVDNHAAYNTAQEQALAPVTRTPVAIEEAKRLRKVDETNIRFVKNNYIDPGLGTGKVSPEQYLSLGLNLPDGISTPAPTPATWPISHYDLNTLRQVGVTSEDSGNGRKALPDGVGWIEHTWRVFLPGEPIPEPMPNIASFDQFETWTKASEPCILRFNEALRRGAIVHTSRWVNTRSEPGPWAPIEVVTIP
jgi:hypothetical protein